MSENNYYFESNKTNNNTPERSFPNDKVAGLSSPTPYPTLTDSQQKDFVFERERIKLNNILHTGKLTNCNVSTFSDYEFADSSFVEDVLDDSPEITKCLNASEIEKGCCYLI